MGRHARYLLQGLIISVPVVVTFYILWAVVAWLDVNMRQLMPQVTRIPGAGILVAITGMYLLGRLTSVYLFQRIFSRGEEMIERVPLVKSLYASVRDMLAFFGDKKKGPRGQSVKVDLGEYGHMLGVTTGTTGPDETIGVFLPLSYQIGGFLIYLPESKISPSDLSVEETLKLILTGGVGASPRTQIMSAESSAGGD